MDRLKLSSKQAKLIKSLKIKKFRYQERLFLVEGKKNVDELLSSELNINFIVATPEFINSQGYLADSTGIETYLISAKDLSSLGTLKTNTECLAVVHFSDKKKEINKKEHLFLFDNLNDPGNLGTIIRTLDWFGFNQIICSENTTDYFSPKVVNTSKGSVFRLNVMYDSLLSVISNLNRPVYLMDMLGTSIYSLNLNEIEPSIFIFGNESHGISSELKKTTNQSITIPRFGNAESLNVAMATGILCSRLKGATV